VFSRNEAKLMVDLSLRLRNEPRPRVCVESYQGRSRIWRACRSNLYKAKGQKRMHFGDQEFRFARVGVGARLEFPGEPFKVAWRGRELRAVRPNV
jgi:hypothetical protein